MNTNGFMYDTNGRLVDANGNPAQFAQDTVTNFQNASGADFRTKKWSESINQFIHGWSFIIIPLFTVAAVLGVVAFAYSMSQVDDNNHHDAILNGYHTKDNRKFILRDFVVLYNETVVGVFVAQDSIVIGVPPGSGVIIFNKKRSLNELNDHGIDPSLIIEETENEYLVAHTNEMRAHLAKRKIPIAIAVPKDEHEKMKRGIDSSDAVDSQIGGNWPNALTDFTGKGIKLSGGPNGMGGPIIGASSIQAASFVQSRQLPSHVLISPGVVVGPLTDGNVAPGYGQNPSQGLPLVNQEFNQDIDDSDTLGSIRLDETNYAIFYNLNNTEIDMIKCSVDANNHQSCSSAVPLITATPIGIKPQFCSLQDAAGNFPNIILVVYADGSIGGNNNIRYAICDIGGSAPSCTIGLLGLTGHAFLNDMTCQSHPLLPDQISKRGAPVVVAPRLVTLAYTDATAGWAQTFLFDADLVNSQPSTRTPRVKQGLVFNLTDTSNSSDLAGQIDAIKVERMEQGYLALTWRTGASLTEAKVQIMYIDVVSWTLNLTSRSPTSFVSPFDNVGDNSWDFDFTVSASRTYQSVPTFTLYIVFDIGFSLFGKVAVQVISNPYVTPSWIYYQVTEFANDLNPIFTSSFSSAPVTVEAVCNDRAVISYITGGTDFTKIGRAVLAHMNLSPSCVSLNTCLQMSSTASFSTVLAYDMRTMWRTYASDSFNCTANLSPFITVFAVFSDYDSVNTSIYSAPGLAGHYTVSFTPLDVPRYPIGIVTAFDSSLYLATVQSSGSINLCTQFGSVGGHPCPLEAPAPIYACPGGMLSTSLYCDAPDARGVPVQIGYVDVNGEAELTFTGAPAA